MSPSLEHGTSGTASSPTSPPSTWLPLTPHATLEDEAARRRLQLRMFGLELPTLRVGRFGLERQLGAGSMGTVWAAWDEELERRVALKILRPELHPGRLVDEARALAKLSHPNVVSVYEVGEHEGRAWIAMELISGRTMRQVDHSQVSRAETLVRWIAVGRGLAAVHTAGLIHRDVKPDNVLLGEDGRARLIDFGLVRSLESQSARLQTRDEGSDGAEASMATSLSREGFAGTRAYAAPEQLASAPLDARADQFAFAVSLWEALTGQRPSRVPPGPSRVRLEGATMPRHVRRALSRALAHDPALRFADMPALLSALEPPRGRRIALAMTGAVAVAAAVGFVNASDGGRQAPPCARVDSAVSELWDGPAREQLGSDLPVDVGVRGREAIDRWVEAWRVAARSSCEASLVERVRSPLAHDRRMACLERGLIGLTAMLRASERGEIASVGDLAGWLEVLEPPDSCLVEAIIQGGPGPVPTQIAEAVRQLRMELARERVGVAARPRLAERVERVRELEARARELGWPPLVGEAALVLGSLEAMAGDPDARDAYGRALDLAREAGDLELESSAWGGLVLVARDLEFDLGRATWAHERRAKIVAMLGSAPRQRGLLAAEQGLLAAMRGDPSEAERALLEAEAELASLGPAGAWQRAAALRDLGNLRVRAGDSAGALELFARARQLELELDDASVLADDPIVAQARRDGLTAFDEGLAQLAGGAFDHASASFERARAAWIIEQGPRSRGVMRAELGLAAVADAKGDLAAARDHAELAARLADDASGAMSIDRADVLSTVGTVAFRDGRFEDAAAAFELVLTIRLQLQPDHLVDVALSRSNLAEAVHALGSDRRAAQLLADALPILEDELPADHPDLGYPLKARAAVELSLGNPELAAELAERALGIFDGDTEVNRVERAETLWLAARAERACGREDRALALADRARRSFEALGDAGTKTVAAIDRWQAHPDPTITTNPRNTTP